MPVSKPCIICFAELEDAWKPEHQGNINQPYAGTVFTSHGQYGSTVFGPMADGTKYLEINICDKCLKSRALLGLVIYNTLNYDTGAHLSKDWVLGED